MTAHRPKPRRAAAAHRAVRPASTPPARPVTRLSPRAADADVEVGGRRVHLSNLGKEFWPGTGITKRDLLRYYVDVSTALLPHLRDRAMVMKRYPDGAAGSFFFMKRAPKPRPEWIRVCSIPHGSAGVIDFPIIDDVAALLWVVNLGCIDLNPWYAPCDDFDRPDALHFDLDPVGDVPFARVREAALVVHEALERIGMPSHAKTTGSRGIHVYVPIARGPLQKDVWQLAKRFALTLAGARPELLTAEYRIARRPAGRVLVDYNQNAWGRTLASVYSVRPRSRPTVSTPVSWRELERGVDMEAFEIANVPARVRRLGDLWAPLLPEAERRFDLASHVG